jgi:parvulin-like peptidyl-prolyl isomerase
MFESFRRNQRLLLVIVLVLIIPAFVLVGAWDMVSPAGDAGTVAKVGKQKIQYPQWERAHQQTIERIRAQLGGRIDASILDSPAARLGTLEDMVTQQVLIATARDLKVVVSDEQVRLAIASIPQVQKDGKFDMALYQQALKAQGLTAENFEQQVKTDIATELLPNVLATSTLAPRSVARRLAQAANEQRTVRVKRFPAADYLAQVSLADADIEKFYQENLQRFQTPEEIDVAVLQFAKADTAEKAEQFVNIVYEQSDSLQPAAEKFGLTVQSVNGVRRNGPTAAIKPELAAALANPKLLAALFDADALVNKRNTEAIEIAPGVLVGARVSAYRPAAPMALAAVRPQIERQLREKQAEEKALLAAQGLVGKMGTDAPAAAALLGPARTLSRASAAKSDLPVPVLQSIFNSEAKSLPQASTIAASPGSPVAWLVVIDSVSVPAVDSAEVKAALGQEFALLERANTQDLLDRWIALRKEAVGVTLYSEKLTSRSTR